MRTRSYITMLLFAAVAMVAAHAAVVDGIVATVNGQIILKSDWQDEIRYEAFMGGQSPELLTSPASKAALDHLIDQELLRQQMRETDPDRVSTQEIDAQIKEVRKQYQGADKDGKWRSVLAAAKLTENDLRKRIGLQLKLARLVDQRLRPVANVTAKSVESYYNQQLLPQLRQSGAKEVPLADVSTKIKELLVQKRINELLTSWLQTLHSGSKIRTQLSESGHSDQSNE